MPHRAGFVHIIGKPNVGKSTLFNALIDHPLSIATPKPQTTRSNITGIAGDSTHQVVYIDTPGYLKPRYGLQYAMMRDVQRALVASDLLLWLVDIRESSVDPLLNHHAQAATPLLLLLNKSDRLPPTERAKQHTWWQKEVQGRETLPITAHDPNQVGALAERIAQQMPEHPPYYDPTYLSDRPSRFFAAEMVRKAIFLHYREEIPYSTAVVTERFEAQEERLLIHVTIYVEHLRQKAIIIGKQGKALKEVGTQARQALEDFFKKKIFLIQRVKVAANWRNQKKQLHAWGHI